jgi:hypothetical protein
LIPPTRSRFSKFQTTAADPEPCSKPHWAISGGLWRSSLEPALAAKLTHSLFAYRAIPIRGAQSACVSGIHHQSLRQDQIFDDFSKIEMVPASVSDPARSGPLTSKELSAQTGFSYPRDGEMARAISP